MKPVLYISFNLATLGGNPGDLTVINWGFVAYTSDRTRLGSLSVNTVPGKVDPGTVEWFNSTEDLRLAYKKCTEDPKTPEQGMKEIRDWITSVSSGYRPILVAYPTIFDGSLLYAYWFRFLGHPSGGKGPGFTMIDIRSYAAGKLGIEYFEASKERALNKYVPYDLPHTHTGLDDAEEQMHLLFNIMYNTPPGPPPLVVHTK